MKQIIINLLSNAAKFTEPGGTIDVTARIDNASGDAVIVVRDTGVGIPAEDIPRVLEPFTQIGSSMTRQHEETGLGLPLVRKMTELHGGRMELESTLGEGAMVQIWLPAGRVVEPGEKDSLAGRAR